MAKAKAKVKVMEIWWNRDYGATFFYKVNKRLNSTELRDILADTISALEGMIEDVEP